MTGRGKHSDGEPTLNRDVASMLDKLPFASRAVEGGFYVQAWKRRMSRSRSKKIGVKWGGGPGKTCHKGAFEMRISREEQSNACFLVLSIWIDLSQHVATKKSVDGNCSADK